MPTGTAQLLPNSGQVTYSGGKISLTRNFQVQTTSFSENESDVLRALGLPYEGQQHPDFTNARVVDFAVKRKAPNSKFFIVTVTYQTPDIEKDDATSDSPLDEPPQITVSTQTDTVSMTGENDGTNETDVLRNSAGQIFPDPPNKRVSYKLITVVRNESTSFDPLDSTYDDSINSGVVFGRPAKTCLMLGIDSVTQHKRLSDGSKVDYRRTTYRIEHKPSGYEIELADIGDFYLDGTDEAKVYFKSEDGIPYVGRLDGSGGELDSTSDTVYLPPKKPYKVVDWSGLDLPSSI